MVKARRVEKLGKYADVTTKVYALVQGVNGLISGGKKTAVCGSEEEREKFA